MKNTVPFLVILSLTSALAAISGIHKDDVSPDKMCEEVAHEVNNAFLEGIISEEVGHQIIANCFSNL